jgi:hypothetical protein
MASCEFNPQAHVSTNVNLPAVTDVSHNSSRDSRPALPCSSRSYRIPPTNETYAPRQRCHKAAFFRSGSRPMSLGARQPRSRVHVLLAPTVLDFRLHGPANILAYSPSACHNHQSSCVIVARWTAPIAAPTAYTLLCLCKCGHFFSHEREEKMRSGDTYAT